MHFKKLFRRVFEQATQPAPAPTRPGPGPSTIPGKPSKIPRPVPPWRPKPGHHTKPNALEENEEHEEQMNPQVAQFWAKRRRK